MMDGALQVRIVIMLYVNTESQRSWCCELFCKTVFFTTLLVAASGAYSVADWCLDVCC